MIETGIDEEPLFSPGGVYVNGARLAANIGGEVSLWWIAEISPRLRVYAEDGYGEWVTHDMRKRLEYLVSQRSHTAVVAARFEKIMRHMDTIELYAAMLDRGLTEDANAKV